MMRPRPYLPLRLTYGLLVGTLTTGGGYWISLATELPQAGWFLAIGVTILAGWLSPEVAHLLYRRTTLGRHGEKTGA